MSDAEQGHTPGPWEWVGNDLDGGEHGWDSVIETEVSCGAWCQGGMVRLTVKPADARLIAAAPDLLAALREVLAAQAAGELSYRTSAGRGYEAMLQVEAAIEAATAPPRSASVAVGETPKPEPESPS